MTKPYKFFFLIGAIAFFCAIVVWLPYGFGIEVRYPGTLHSRLVISGFLMAYILGFMTSIFPQMLGATPTQASEFWLLFIFYLCTLVSSFFERLDQFHYVSFSLLLITLLIFCVRRIISRKSYRPPFYPMVLISILSGISGCVAYLYGEVALAKLLLYQNFILCLCIGIGSKLIPMILGSGCNARFKASHMWSTGVILFIGCFIEMTNYALFAQGSRAVVLTYVAFFVWRIHQSGKMRTTLTRGVRLAVIMILIGAFGIWLGSSMYYLEYLHIVFIGGFTLLTLMVGARLILGFGAYDLRIELKNWRLRFVIFLALFGMATRFSAPFIKDGYERHLAYAALVLLAALMLWGQLMLPKLRRCRI